ncbi:MAG: hypothetical protein JWR61_583 [Ferruginibacter sp.]|nr:hypothetical protein [Ferruginibacter sp.]
MLHKDIKIQRLLKQTILLKPGGIKSKLMQYSPNFNANLSTWQSR